MKFAPIMLSITTLMTFILGMTTPNTAVSLFSSTWLSVYTKHSMPGRSGKVFKLSESIMPMDDEIFLPGTRIYANAFFRMPRGNALSGYDVRFMNATQIQDIKDAYKKNSSAMNEYRFDDMEEERESVQQLAVFQKVQNRLRTLENRNVNIFQKISRIESSPPIEHFADNIMNKIRPCAPNMTRGGLLDDWDYIDFETYPF